MILRNIGIYTYLNFFIFVRFSKSFFFLSILVLYYFSITYRTHNIVFNVSETYILYANLLPPRSDFCLLKFVIQDKASLKYSTQRTELYWVLYNKLKYYNSAMYICLSVHLHVCYYECTRSQDIVYKS